MRLIFIAAMLCTLSACGRAEHKISTSEARNFESVLSGEQFRVDDEVFSGVVYSSHDNGQRAFEVELKDGRIFGNLRRWTTSGQVIEQLEAYQKEDRGRRVQYREWTSEGTLTNLQDYNDAGELVLHKQWSDTGEPFKFQEYDENGKRKLTQYWCGEKQKQEERQFDAGSLLTVKHWSCETGNQISHLRFASDGGEGLHFMGTTDPERMLTGRKSDGLQKIWYPDGTVKRITRYDDGVKSGEEELFYPDGKAKSKVRWEAIETGALGRAVRVGEYEEWYADGTPKTKGQFDDSGEKTGLWKEWDANGEIRVADYDRSAYIDRKYLQPFAAALRDDTADQALYYIKKDLVAVDAKLPTSDDAMRVDANWADRWPKRYWTYPVIIANRGLLQPLVEAGADINQRDSYGRTRLLVCAKLLASGGCDGKGLEAVLQAGGNAATVDSFEQSALHKVVNERSRYRVRQEEQVKGIQTLIAAGAPIDAQDYMGRTALMIALANRRPDLAGPILDAGPDLSLYNNHGQKAVHFVFLTQHDRYNFRDDEFTRSMLKRLADAGADVDASIPWNGEAVTLYDLAVQSGNIELAKYLESLGAAG